MSTSPQIIFDQIRFGEDGAFLNDSDPVGVANLQTTNLVAQENTQRRARYLSSYAQFRVNMESGQPMPAERRIAPVPEMSQAISAADPKGFVHAFESNVPIMEPLPDVFYHGVTIAEQNAARSANVFKIGHVTGNAGWFSVDPADTMPEGHEETLPGPDGKIMTVRKQCSPWGCSYKQTA